MAKFKKEKSTKKNMTKPVMKNCKVKLTRLSSATIERFLSNEMANLNEQEPAKTVMKCSESIVQHTIKISIRKNALRVGDYTQMASKNNSLFLQLKLSPNGVTVLNRMMNLRPRPNLALVNVVAQKMPPVKTISCRIKYKNVNEAWSQCKKKYGKDKYALNDIVMAKVSGFFPWPSKIVDVLDRNKFKVEFFGAEPHERFGFVTRKEITLFKDSSDVIRVLIHNSHDIKFKKAVRETEIFCCVPESQSIFDS